MDPIHAGHYPEIAVGGYTSADGTVEFYGRVNALLQPHWHALDYGCGRAAWTEDPVPFRRELRRLQGKVARVVGADIDPAVMENPTVDERVVFEPNAPLPFADASFDLVVSDYVFEHVEDAAQVAAELDRIVRPGGYICARTPYKHSLLSMATRVIHNGAHTSVLKYAQPGRQARDVFPTAYRLNTRRDIEKVFPPDRWDATVYKYASEPTYHFGRRWIYDAMVALDRVLPVPHAANLFIFLRKR